MPIPDDELFEGFLAETKVVTEKPDGPHEKLGSPMHFSKDMQEDRPPQLYLVFPNSDLTIQSVLEKIRQTLRENDSPSDRKSALATLALIVESKKDSNSYVSHANEVLSRYQDCEAHVSWVLPVEVDDEYKINICPREMELSTFDPEKILYWAERGNSRYPLDLRQHKGKLSLTKRRLPVRSVKWRLDSFMVPLREKWENVADLMIDVYFQAMLDHVRMEWKKLLSEAIVIEEAGKLWHFDFESLRNFNQSLIIGIFCWKDEIGRASWAVTNQPYSTYIIPDKETLPAQRRWLKDELDFEELSTDNPFDASVERFAKQLQQAEWHLRDRRSNESFLFRMIALDLLFGEEQRQAESIARRTAVLVHRQLGNPFVETYGRMKSLYKARSKYTHRGIRPETDEIEDLNVICRETLWCVLAASAQDSFETLGEWIDEIDYLAGALKAQKQADEKSFERVGVPKEGHQRSPPYQ